MSSGSLTVFVRGRLLNYMIDVLKKYKNNHAQRRVINGQQEQWVLQLKAQGAIAFMAKAEHVTLDVIIHRTHLYYDDDNMRTSFNKFVMDGIKRAGGIKDDSMKYLTIRSIEQVKCRKEQEGIEIKAEWGLNRATI